MIVWNDARKAVCSIGSAEIGDVFIYDGNICMKCSKKLEDDSYDKEYYIVNLENGTIITDFISCNYIDLLDLNITFIEKH